MFGAAYAATAQAGSSGGHRVCGRVGDDFAYADRVVTLQPGSATARSDAEGRFCFEAVADGDYLLGVAPYCVNGLECFPELPLTVAGSDVDATLAPEQCDSSALRAYPAAAAPGAEVEVVGWCQCLHSGGTATLSFDDTDVGLVHGDTGGCFRARFTIPPNTPAGPHRLTVPLSFQLGAATGSLRVPGVPDCAGDCDGSEVVTIDELLRGIGVALGTRPLADCRALDSSGDGSAMIDEVTAAVGRALRGCPARPEPVSLEAVYDVTATFERGSQRGMAIVRDAGGGELSLQMLFTEFDSIAVSGNLQADGTVQLEGGSIRGGDVYSPAVGVAAADIAALGQRIDGSLEIDDFFNGTEVVTYSLRRPASGTSAVDTVYQVTLDHAPPAGPAFRSTLQMSIRDAARRGLGTCSGDAHVDASQQGLPDLPRGACALSPEGRFSFRTQYRNPGDESGPLIYFFGTLSAAGSGAASNGTFYVGAVPELTDDSIWAAQGDDRR